MAQFDKLPLRSPQRGFTLTELAIVLGVFGLVLGAIWGAQSVVGNNHKLEKAQQQVLQILSGYRTLYPSGQMDPVGVTDITCFGINAGWFPGDMLQPGNSCAGGTPTAYPLSPWGQTVTVRTLPVYNAILITYWNLPTSACIGLAAGEANSTGIIWSAVGPSGTGPNEMVYPPFGTASPMTMQQINSFCSASNNNEVTFGYAL